MKKVSLSRGEHIKPVRVYLDDLEEIVAIIEGTCEEIAVQVEDKILDNLDELTSLNKELIHDMKISGRRPYVSVELGPNNIWLFISEDSPESRGLYEKIKAILLRSRRHFTWLLHSPFLFGIVWPLTIGGGLWGLKVKSIFLLVLFAALFVACIYWAVYGFRDLTKRFTIVVPKHRIESPGFMKRNRDKIILAIISALIGAALGYILK